MRLLYMNGPEYKTLVDLCPRHDATRGTTVKLGRFRRGRGLRTSAKPFTCVSKLVDERTQGHGRRIRQQGVQRARLLDRAIFENGRLLAQRPCLKRVVGDVDHADGLPFS